MMPLAALKRAAVPCCVEAAMRLVILAIFALLVSACTSAVVLAPPATADARPILLLDHGRHASLVLPLGDSAMVRYSYGEWRWYAERTTGVLRAVPTVLWPTQGALGRRVLAAAPDSAGVRRTLRVRVEHLYELRAEADAIRRLRARLDSLFEAGRATRLYSDEHDLEFVHHPSPYWGLRTSNQMVAGWLQELGFRVHGPALWSRWRVQ